MAESLVSQCRQLRHHGRTLNEEIFVPILAETREEKKNQTKH
jgi:hypothetical protein